MNRIFKRKLVFVKVCSPFSFIRFTNAEKIKKKKDVRRSLSRVRVLLVRVLQVRVLLVHLLQVRFTNLRFLCERIKSHKTAINLSVDHTGEA